MPRATGRLLPTVAGSVCGQADVVRHCIRVRITRITRIHHLSVLLACSRHMQLSSSVVRQGGHQQQETEVPSTAQRWVCKQSEGGWVSWHTDACVQGDGQPDGVQAAPVRTHVRVAGTCTGASWVGGWAGGAGVAREAAAGEVWEATRCKPGQWRPSTGRWWRLERVQARQCSSWLRLLHSSSAQSQTLCRSRMGADGRCTNRSGLCMLHASRCALPL